MRKTVDIPDSLHRWVKRRAAIEHVSFEELIVRGIEYVLREPPRKQRKRGRRAKLPLIRSKGPKVYLDNEMIYGTIDFP
jgi:hypothetical protein